MEDIELVSRCREDDDEEAFEKLISKYEGRIYNTCYYMLKNKEDAMDASQEVCIKLYKSIKRFKGESKFSTWVYRITYNTCIDYLKKRKDEISYDDVINSDIHIENRVDNIIESKELRLELKRCILNLNNDFRTVIILRDIHGISYQEIAQILNIEVGTVKSRINRAREALRKELIKNGIVRGRQDGL